MPFIGRGSTGQSGGGPSGSRHGGRGPSTSGLASSRSSAPGAAAAEEGLTAEYAIEDFGGARLNLSYSAAADAEAIEFSRSYSQASIHTYNTWHLHRTVTPPPLHTRPPTPRHIPHIRSGARGALYFSSHATDPTASTSR